MKSKQKRQVAREESFDVENPDISIYSISSDVRVLESLDGKCHIKVLADSEKAAQLADLVEIVATSGKLTVRIDKKNRSFFGLGNGGLRGLSLELALPHSLNLKIKIISGDIEVTQAFSNIEIGSISGNVTINQNPSGNCTVKTISGDIAIQTFSGCEYNLKSISGDIKVSIAPDLNVEVDGNSISGNLGSEISLEENREAPSNNSTVVKITASTISGNFNLIRN